MNIFYRNSNISHWHVACNVVIVLTYAWIEGKYMMKHLRWYIRMCTWTLCYATYLYFNAIMNVFMSRIPSYIPQKRRIVRMFLPFFGLFFSFLLVKNCVRNVTTLFLNPMAIQKKKVNPNSGCNEGREISLGMYKLKYAKRLLRNAPSSKNHHLLYTIIICYIQFASDLPHMQSHFSHFNAYDQAHVAQQPYHNQLYNKSVDAL